MKVLLKFILIVLFVVCFCEGLPYWYFVFLKTFGMVAFYWLYFSEKEKAIWKYIWVISIIVIQPFLPIEMKRENWLAVDVFWIILLLIGIFENLMNKDIDFDINNK
ncbi:DUF6804 family protein [Flavobacterium sp. KACC 22761]|uniref:DUF6804 family protein n=1 Tax=Flavobacterium sp. KACC 22761 TaxID=3092665 RepID=UPI002A75A17C|nr:DUF6804 family protein [Flavobacterium sp. KACC 22761]WPO77226.1 DUF6804 family protein [Flavobacterium sp. KACC 22761]